MNDFRFNMASYNNANLIRVMLLNIDLLVQLGISLSMEKLALQKQIIFDILIAIYHIKRYYYILPFKI